MAACCAALPHAVVARCAALPHAVMARHAAPPQTSTTCHYFASNSSQKRQSVLLCCTPAERAIFSPQKATESGQPCCSAAHQHGRTLSKLRMRRDLTSFAVQPKTSMNYAMEYRRSAQGATFLSRMTAKSGNPCWPVVEKQRARAGPTAASHSSGPAQVPQPPSSSGGPAAASPIPRGRTPRTHRARGRSSSRAP